MTRFSIEGLLEYPQWAKPADFRSWTVPEVLLNIANRPGGGRRQSLIRTLENRPDLLRDAPLTQEDQEFLATYINQKLEESQSTEE